MLEDGVLTIPEVAAELRCSKAHVYNVINGRVKGVSSLPAIVMGRASSFVEALWSGGSLQTNGVNSEMLFWPHRQ